MPVDNKSLSYHGKKKKKEFKDIDVDKRYSSPRKFSHNTS